MNITVSLNDLLYYGLSDPSTFQYHFNIQVYQTLDEARQLVTLPAHLIGKAKRAWDALTNTEKASIGTAMPALIKALDKPKDTLLSMFFAEKRRDDEPLVCWVAARDAARLVTRSKCAYASWSDSQPLARAHACTDRIHPDDELGRFACCAG